jgi:EmrB/QacA subfamily drug resistance transporter
MRKEEAVSTRSGGAALALLAFAQFVIAVDYNIVYVGLPEIGAVLGFTPQSLQWVVSSYAVAFGGFLLLGGRLVDRAGGRRVFVAGLLVFGLSCLAAAAVQDPGTLVAARAAQGFGAALLAPATLALIGTRFAEGSERTRALAVWGAAGSGGLAAGALLGGVLTQAFGWRSVFLVLVPLALGGAACAPGVLPAARPLTRPRLDVPGAALATAGSMLVVLGLVRGPEAGWLAADSVGAIAGGLVMLGVFVAVERRTREPLLPMRLLTRRTLVTAIGVILVFQSALGGAYYLFTLYLQGVLGYSALQAGLVFVPLTVISMAASLRLSGLLLARWGLRPTLVAAMVLNGAGLLVLAVTMTAQASFWLLLPGLVAWGIGGGVTFPAMFVAAASGVDPREAGVASALATAAQQVGGAAGLAALVAVATAATGSGGEAALADGLRAAMAVGAAASVVGGLLALALRRASAPAVRVPQE